MKKPKKALTPTIQSPPQNLKNTDSEEKNKTSGKLKKFLSNLKKPKKALTPTTQSPPQNLKNTDSEEKNRTSGKLKKFLSNLKKPKKALTPNTQSPPQNLKNTDSEEKSRTSGKLKKFLSNLKKPKKALTPTTQSPPQNLKDTDSKNTNSKKKSRTPGKLKKFLSNLKKPKNALIPTTQSPPQNLKDTNQKENKTDSIRGNRINNHIRFLKIIMCLSFIMLMYLAFENSQLSKQIEGIKQLVAQRKTELSRHIGSIKQLVTQRKTVGALKIIKSEKYADDACAIAAKHIQSGDFEKGRIYLINAINHNPSEIEYISKLLVLFRDQYASNYNVLREIKSVVELSLFQLAPNKIETAIKYLTELDSAEQKLISSVPEVSGEKTDWLAEFNTLKELDLNEISTNVAKLEERLNILKTILSNIRNSETDYDQLTSSVMSEIKTVNNVYNLSIIGDKINNYIQLLYAETDYSSQAASARFLAASSSMSLFWEYDLTLLPPKLSNLIQNDYPAKLENIEDKIKEAKSLPHFKKANKTLVDASNDETGTYQNRIDRHQKAIEKAVNLMPKIVFKDFRDTLQNNFKILQDNITSYKRQQYIAYQKWASEVCSDVFDNVEKECLFTDDAIRIFDSSELRNIDLRLASPEVSQAYNKVFQKIIGELPAKIAFEGHKIVMTSQKKTLEEF
ncbi:hypothetical protein QUF90_03455 [Desulfococcaceae bacterium HSG9]|nr:hypothetical protein [Desulfococcaceae bacterium HSG9]